jgi:hypothetical protein
MKINSIKKRWRKTGIMIARTWILIDVLLHRKNIHRIDPHKAVEDAHASLE